MQRRDVCEDRTGFLRRCRQSVGEGNAASAGVINRALFLSLVLLPFFSLLLLGKGLPVADSILSAPDTAYFGLTRVGICDTLRLPIVNKGSGLFILDSVRFTADPFSSLQLIDTLKSLSLTAGSRESLRVAFCPNDTFCVAGSLIIYGHVQETGEDILHPIGLGGCGGAPFIKVDKGELKFDSVAVSHCRRDSVTIMNVGNYPLRIDSLSLSNPAFRVVDPTQFPSTLLPYSGRTVTLEFCPVKVGIVFDTLRIHSGANSKAFPVALYARSYLPQLLVPERIDVGSVPLGNCVDTFLVVRNVGTENITITNIQLAELPLPGGFSLNMPWPSDKEWDLAPGEILRISVRFCPLEARQYAEPLQIWNSTEPYTSILLGNGILPFAWLDTADVEAGEIATLTFRVGPIDAGGSGPYQIELQFNPDALFPVGAVSVVGGSVTMSRPDRTSVVIKGNRSEFLLSDAALFTLSLRSLSSGEPTNRVMITRLDFPNVPSRWDTLHGMVRLSGCDVGRTPGAGKRAQISSIGPNPAGGSVVLRYQAPQGRISSLTLFDAGGSRVKSLELPEGTGEMQEFRVDLSGLPRGLYTMELREREERSWSILLIDR